MTRESTFSVNVLAMIGIFYVNFSAKICLISQNIQYPVNCIHHRNLFLKIKLYFPDLKSLYLSIQNDCDFFEGSELGKFLLEFPLRRVKAEAEDAEALRHGRLLAVADVPATVRHRGSAGRHKEREQTKTISTCRQISQF